MNTNPPPEQAASDAMLAVEAFERDWQTPFAFNERTALIKAFEAFATEHTAALSREVERLISAMNLAAQRCENMAGTAVLNWRLIADTTAKDLRKALSATAGGKGAGSNG